MMTNTINRPQQFMLRYAKGKHLFLLLSLVVVGAAALIAVFTANGEITKPEDALGPIALGLMMIIFILLFNGARASSRWKETCAINRFFDEVWAQWGFGAGELPILPPRKGASPGFQIWFGPRGIYHEREGLTQFSGSLVEVNYLENFYPDMIMWVDLPNARGAGRGSADAISPEMNMAMETSTIGDEATPKLEFKLQDGWWLFRSPPTSIYFPVARGHEQEAKMLVQRYQQEVVR